MKLSPGSSCLLPPHQVALVPSLPCCSFPQDSGQRRSFPSSPPLCQPGQGAMGLHAHAQDASSLPTHRSAPDSPVLSCCNTPTAFYAPWMSSPCALPTPKGLETCGGRGGGGAGRDPRGVSGQAKGEVASGALSAGVAPPSCSPVVGVFCLNAGPGGCWRGVAGQGLGGSPRGWPEDHSKLPSREGTGWGSWWSRPSRPAVLYPGPGSGRSRRWDPTNSVGDHERGWPPAGGLRAGARGDSSRGLVLRRTVLCRTPLHGCLLSSEARILRLQGAS